MSTLQPLMLNSDPRGVSPWGEYEPHGSLPVGLSVPNRPPTVFVQLFDHAQAPEPMLLIPYDFHARAHATHSLCPSLPDSGPGSRHPLSVPHHLIQARAHATHSLSLSILGLTAAIEAGGVPLAPHVAALKVLS